MYSPTRKRGNIAEDLAAQHLENQRYKIIERNYLRKWGEIDIIASKDSIIHFIEVKSVFLGYFSNVSRETDGFPVDMHRFSFIDKTNVSRETHKNSKNGQFEQKNFAVSHETDKISDIPEIFDPTWNMTRKKRKSIEKAIKSYIAERFKADIPEFQVDLMSVSLDYLNKIVYVNMIDNIILAEI